MWFQTCVTLKEDFKGGSHCSLLYGESGWGPEVVKLHESNIKVAYDLYAIFQVS